MKAINELFQNLKDMVFSDNQKVSETITNNQEKIILSNEIQYKLSPDESQKLTSIFLKSNDISELNEQLITKIGLTHEMEDIEKLNQEIEETANFKIDPSTKEKDYFYDLSLVDEYYKKHDEIRTKIGLYLEDQNILISGESDQFMRIQRYPDSIRNIIEPTERIQLAAINNDYNTIGYIRKPTEEVQLIAVEHDPDLIRYIKKPTEKVQLAAITKDYNTIGFIREPSEEVQLIAVKHDPKLIGNIKEPTQRVQLIAVSSDPYLIQAIKNPTALVQLAAEAILNKELYTSGCKTLIADSFTSPGAEDQARNYRILELFTGKTESLNTGDIDLNKQSSESIKKLLSGEKVEMTNKSGLTNLVGLNKTMTGWGISAAKQIFNSADSSAGI